MCIRDSTWSHQNDENVEKWNLMKTLVFTILLRGWDIRIHENFHLKIIKKRDCNPNVILICSNHRKYEKVMQKGLQWETQNPSKITKNQFWSRLSGPLHPMITKIMKKVVSQDPECLKKCLPRPWKIKKCEVKWMKSAWKELCHYCIFQWFQSYKSFKSI